MPQWNGTINGQLEVAYRFVGHDQPPEAQYTFTGGPIVRIGDRLITEDTPRVFAIGTQRLCRIGYDWPHQAVIAARIDGPRWWLAVLWFRLEGINRRILATCYVWGLADYPIERDQVWGDVYLVRWVRRVFRREGA